MKQFLIITGLLLAGFTLCAQTWILVKTLPSSSLTKNSFSSQHNGFSPGSNDSLLRTNDGGKYWSTITIPACSNMNLYGIYVISIETIDRS
ncbi:MAG: hypothetical protein IIA45_06690 [Bacteroidetes bacterium]|nr:hypothetical protein [Bacteroidota bacterium]